MNVTTWLVGVLSVSCCFQGSVKAGQERSPGKARHAQLLNALGSDGWFVRRRAIQELSTRGGGENERWEFVVNRLLALPPNDAQVDSFMVLSGAGSPALPALVGGLESKWADQAGHALLLCVGRMQTGAIEAMPRLAGMLEQPTGDAQTRAVIRVILANLGHKSGSNMTQMRSDIAAHSDAGMATVRAMALARANDWVDAELVSQLLDWLDRPSERSAFAALALGSLGNRAAKALAPLDKLRRLSARDEDLHSYQIIFGFVIAEVDQTRRQRTIRDVLKHIGAEPELNHTDLAAMLNVVWTLADEEFIAELVRTLDEREAKARLGAIKMLETIGMPAQRAMPALFKIAKEDRNRETRRAAFGALGTMLEYSRLKELEKCLQEEETDSVKEGIVRALKLLNLEQQK